MEYKAQSFQTRVQQKSRDRPLVYLPSLIFGMTITIRITLVALLPAHTPALHAASEHDYVLP